MAECKMWGLIHNRKDHSGGNANFYMETYGTLTDRFVQIDFKGKGVDIQISLPVAELMDFLRESDNEYLHREVSSKRCYKYLF